VGENSTDSKNQMEIDGQKAAESDKGCHHDDFLIFFN
jgi:hypothetical protein